MLTAADARRLAGACDRMNRLDLDVALQQITKLIRIAIVHKLQQIEYDTAPAFLTEHSAQVQRLAKKLRARGYKTQFNRKRMMLRISWSAS